MPEPSRRRPQLGLALFAAVMAVAAWYSLAPRFPLTARTVPHTLAGGQIYPWHGVEATPFAFVWSQSHDHFLLEANVHNTTAQPVSIPWADVTHLVTKAGQSKPPTSYDYTPAGAPRAQHESIEAQRSCLVAPHGQGVLDLTWDLTPTDRPASFVWDGTMMPFPSSF